MDRIRSFSFWRRAKEQRKRPWRLIAQALVWKAILSYLLGYLILAQALKKTGVHRQAITLHFSQTGMDINEVGD